MKLASVIFTALTLVMMLGIVQTALAVNYEVEIENFAFTPARLQLNVGDMITWRNRDNVPHTSTSDNAVWDSGILNLGQTFSFTFTTMGTFPYHCSVHPSMKDTIFVGTQTGINDPSATPKEFQLGQNYPNPFNARTIISYTLPSEALVNIDIFNVLGQKVENLVKAQQGAGEHQITWDAINQTSGIYFYRLSVDGLTRTGRMELLK